MTQSREEHTRMRIWAEYTQDTFQDLHFAWSGLVCWDGDVLFKDCNLVGGSLLERTSKYILQTESSSGIRAKYEK